MNLKKILAEIKKESFDVKHTSVQIDDNDKVLLLSDVKRIFKKYIKDKKKKNIQLDEDDVYGPFGGHPLMEE